MGKSANKFATAPTSSGSTATAAKSTTTTNSSTSGSGSAAGAAGAVLVSAIAMFDFAPPPDKVDCIALKKDEPLVIIEQSSDEWWFGKRGDGKDGFFPANYVRIVKTVCVNVLFFVCC